MKKVLFTYILVIGSLFLNAQLKLEELPHSSTQELLNFYQNTLNDSEIRTALSQELLSRKDLDEKNKIWVLSVYSGIQMQEMDIENSINSMQEAKSLALKYKDDEIRLRLMVICLHLAEAYYAMGDSENSEKNLVEFKNLDRELPETPAKIQYLTDYNAFYYYKGDFEKYYTEISKNLQKTKEQKKANTDQTKDDLYLITELAYRLVLLNVSVLQNDPDRIDENFTETNQIMTSHTEIFEPYKSSAPYGNLLFLLSRYYTYKKDFQQAINKLETAKEIGQSENNKTLYFISLVELSKVYYLNGEYEKSFASAKEGLAHKTFYLDFFDYEMEAYRYAALSAKNLGQNEAADSYQELFLTKNNSLKDQKKKELLSKVLTHNEILDATAEKTKKNQFLTYLLIVGLVCLALSIFFILYNRKKNQEKIKNFQSIIARLEENRQIRDKAKAEVSPKSEAEISDKTKQVLAGLEEFENGELYLNKEMSLSALATHLNTNTSTLSSIINQYKKQNFNDYINGLRIEYLIEKFESDTSFRSYKLSHIADLCGFSSHPHLSSSFKKKTGISPSEFLKLLQKQKIITS
jgi:AraC-like DNA-binding protein